MTKNLILIRHAKSSWLPYGRKLFTGIDHQRPINERGKIAAKKIASYLNKKAVTVDKIYSSSATRALQTLKIITKYSNINHESNIKHSLYTFESEKLFKYIIEIDNKYESIIIIGHNPAMREVCLNLIKINFNDKLHENILNKFPTCGMAFIEFQCEKWNEIKQNCGILKNFVTPKLIS